MAAYVKISYNVSSSTNPTYVARYERMDELVEDWIDHVTIGSSGGTVITIEPWAPEGTTVEYYAYTFPTTGVQDLYFFSKTNEIPDYAFNALDNNSYPGHVLSIDCSQSNNDITGIGESTFSHNWGMQSVYLSDNITRIGRNAFEADSAMTVCNIPESLSAIPASMFQYCYSLQHVQIPDSVQSIGTSAFAYCRGLEDVYLGSGLTSFNTFAFGGCSGLTSITATSRNVPITYYTNTFQGVHTGGTLYYPAGYESEYGPESGMLGTQQYLLGYYDWNGIPTGTTPSDRWAYLNPSAATLLATANTSGSFTIYGSGCSIDSAHTPSFIYSGDSGFVGDIYARFITDLTGDGFVTYYRVSRNLTASERNGTITVNGIYDTDGNVYNGLVHQVTQPYGSYVFANYDKSSITSAASDTIVEIVGVNTNICSVTVSGFTGYPDSRWEGFEQPSYTQLGNYITVHFPENPTSSRSVRFSAVTIYGENCENTQVLRCSINQPKSGGTPTPTQKDIKAAHTGFTVDSGNGHASTYVLTSGCTYDHFTYITGGSFSVTADTFPGDSILFNIPENPTNSARTGYVYFTFYDSDGNPYGPQTITFNQQAGSSPGPGPGPDPETGYVLTTLTISDQEQHRYFVEARPGVVYSAAGQYYKTISACEARYSLYYVNSYGGVDVLPFKEKSWKKSDTVTRFNYSRSFRNNTLEFENVNYMNEIKASWELHTGWMSDESSQRMHELVESTIVYLYDAEEKTYTPVVMTDKKLEYKTYHNQGKKFYNYTVNVEESQSKERR